MTREYNMRIQSQNHTGLHDSRRNPADKALLPQELEKSTVTILLVKGMGCPTCAMRVRDALLLVEGVLDVSISSERGLAFVRYDPIRTRPHALPAAVPAANDGPHCYTARVLDSL